MNIQVETVLAIPCCSDGQQLWPESDTWLQSRNGDGTWVTKMQTWQLILWRLKSKVWHHITICICLILPALPRDSLMSQSAWVIPHVYPSACNRNAGANAWLCCHFVTPSKTCSTFVLCCLSAVQFSSASACLARASLAKVSVANIRILPLPWSLDEVGYPKHWVQSFKQQHTCFVKHPAVQLRIETPRANLATQSRFTPLEWLLIARKSACFYCCLHTQSAKAEWLRCHKQPKQPRTGPPRDQCLRTLEIKWLKWLKWLKSQPMKPDLSVNPLASQLGATP